MAEKFHKLQDLLIDSYDLGAPLEIEEGELLLEVATKTVQLKLKLNILGTDPSQISSVTVHIECLNDAAEVITDLSPFSFCYMDIFLLKGKSFGNDTPIILDPRVRKVNVKLTRVVFIDTSTWGPSIEQIKFPKQKSITSLNPQLVEQHKRNISALSRATKAIYRYLPEQLASNWLCTCGRPNLPNTITCVRCGLSKEIVFHITKEILQKDLDDFLDLQLQEKKALIKTDEITVPPASITKKNSSGQMKTPEPSRKNLPIDNTVKVLMAVYIFLAVLSAVAAILMDEPFCTTVIVILWLVILFKLYKLYAQAVNPTESPASLYRAKCPTCGSPNIHKISAANKAGNAFLFGIYAVGHINKTFECKDCKYKW